MWSKSNINSLKSRVHTHGRYQRINYKNENNMIYLKESANNHCKNIEIYVHKNLFLDNKCDIIQLVSTQTQSHQYLPWLRGQNVFSYVK